MTTCCILYKVNRMGLAAVDLIRPGRNMGGGELEVCLLSRGEQWEEVRRESWTGRARFWA